MIDAFGVRKDWWDAQPKQKQEMSHGTKVALGAGAGAGTGLALGAGALYLVSRGKSGRSLKAVKLALPKVKAPKNPRPPAAPKPKQAEYKPVELPPETFGDTGPKNPIDRHPEARSAIKGRTSTKDNPVGPNVRRSSDMEQAAHMINQHKQRRAAYKLRRKQIYDKTVAEEAADKTAPHLDDSVARAQTEKASDLGQPATASIRDVDNSNPDIPDNLVGIGPVSQRVGKNPRNRNKGNKHAGGEGADAGAGGRHAKRSAPSAKNGTAPDTSPPGDKEWKSFGKRDAQIIAKRIYMDMMDDIAKASITGDHGDKRNTKYALAGATGMVAGSSIGTRLGARMAGTTYRKNREKVHDLMVKETEKGRAELKPAWDEWKKHNKTETRVAAKKVGRKVLRMTPPSPPPENPKEWLPSIQRMNEINLSVKGTKHIRYGGVAGSALGLAAGAGAYGVYRHDKAKRKAARLTAPEQAILEARRDPEPVVKAWNVPLKTMKVKAAKKVVLNPIQGKNYVEYDKGIAVQRQRAAMKATT